MVNRLLTRLYAWWERTVRKRDAEMSYRWRRENDWR